ncbi:hypothetical protein LZ198_38100 [Myxococcus sp. K15C18031901]|uniref:hypothetical protein n=1 Tax=Myxococcus dinghuensis TaxID=2906761 RepID=UPI0020A7087D|nr:hypothetical protein [Myxococcus dinghuensis]MCP3104694.1 hypothetical protein [Myxococcus dinghuensis]
MPMVGKISGGSTIIEDVSRKSFTLASAVEGKTGDKVLFEESDDGDGKVVIIEEGTLRPVFRQRAPRDCALAAVRMAFITITSEDVGFDAIVDVFGDLKAYDKALGASVEAIPKVMNQLFKQTHYWRNRTLDVQKMYQKRLATVVSDRRPAFAILKDPNHVVVVDSVVRGEFPKVTIHYRDPACSSVQVFDKAASGKETGEFGVRATGLFFVNQ